MASRKKIEEQKTELYNRALKERQGKKGTKYSVKAMEIYNANYSKGPGRI